MKNLTPSKLYRQHLDIPQRKPLGKKLVQLRSILQITRREFANLIGVSRNTLENIEQSRVTSCCWTLIQKIVLVTKQFGFGYEFFETPELIRPATAQKEDLSLFPEGPKEEKTGA